MIKQLKNSSAQGDDLIDTFAIKAAAEALYKPVQFVINLSISTNTFPHEMEIGESPPTIEEF